VKELHHAPTHSDICKATRQAHKQKIEGAEGAGGRLGGALPGGQEQESYQEPAMQPPPEIHSDGGEEWA
jgi:hypothetical protein